MNIQQIEKLKGLIASSPILTPKERAEWLGLLELMNDKQMGELEKILTSSQLISKSADQQVSTSAVKQTPSPSLSHDGRGMGAGDTKVVPRSEPVKQPPVTPMPKLSHIMNLPRIGMSENRNVGESDNRVIKNLGGYRPGAAATAQHGEKKKSGFAAKLKAIFAEKELPAGRFAKPLELAEGKPANQQATRLPLPKAQFVGGQSPSASQPISKGLPTVRLPLKSGEKAEAPKAAKPAPSLPPKVPIPPAKPAVKPVVVPVVPVVLQVKIQEAPAVSAAAVKQEIKPLNADLQNQLLTLLKHKPAPKQNADFNPGVNFKQASEKSRNDNLEKIKQHMAATGSSQKGISELGKEPAINSLNDLTLIDLVSLKECGLNGFINKIQQLIAKFGYFQVVFNIEESPAYKAYITTGLKLLTDGSEFEQLNNDVEIEKFLDKGSFEKFADMLAKIQSS